MPWTYVDPTETIVPAHTTALTVLVILILLLLVVIQKTIIHSDGIRSVLLAALAIVDGGSLVGIAVLHQAAVPALVRRGVDLVAEIVQQRHLGSPKLIRTSHRDSGGGHRNLDVAIRGGVAGVGVRDGLLNGGHLGGTHSVSGPETQIGGSLTHAGHSGWHLCVRHTQCGRYTQHSRPTAPRRRPLVGVGMGVARVHQLVRIGGQIVGGQLQRMLILAFCRVEKAEEMATINTSACKVSEGCERGSGSAFEDMSAIGLSPPHCAGICESLK